MSLRPYPKCAECGADLDDHRGTYCRACAHARWNTVYDRENSVGDIPLNLKRAYGLNEDE